MRILHVIDYFQPKLGYQETFLAKKQMRHGHIVQVITSDKYARLSGLAEELLGSKSKRIGQYSEEGIDVLRLRGVFKFLTSIWLIGLEKSVSKFNPDTVHVHGIISVTALRMTRLKKRMPNAKLIFDDHMTYDAMRGFWVIPLYKIFKIFFSRRINEAADELIAVTDETKRFMIDEYGFTPERLRIIPLGCDVCLFSRNDQIRRQLREENRIPENGIIFCYVGKIVEKKGVDILVKASIELIKRYDNVFVLLLGAGDKEYVKEIKYRISQSNLDDRFIILPSVPNRELAKYYSMADVGVWPKQCSVTVIEAMCSGIPVIISNKSGGLERVKGKGNGLTYDEGDAYDLSQKMEILISNEKRQEMERMALKYAEDCDWDKISFDFEMIYDRC